MTVRAGTIVALGLALVVLCGCGSQTRPAATAAIPASLLREARPIGSGPRFHPAARGPIIGACRPALGSRRGVHVELFAANRVVVFAGGIGVRGPVTRTGGRIIHARCYGALVTVEPTGVVLLRRGRQWHLADLFRAWGQPLSRQRAASFSVHAGESVRVYVDGRRRRGAPGTAPLVAHSEIVVEVGAYVEPHRSYTFPPGT